MRIAALALAAVTLVSCQPAELPEGADSAAVSMKHVFDYATNGPKRLSIMFTMAWFGISSGDPQSPAGSDPGYHNWAAGGTPCAYAALPAPKPALPDPRLTDTCVLYGPNNVCQLHGAAQRQITSRRRPLTGIWSGTGLDVESQRKIDLMLAMLRRPGCRADDGAKLDAWTMQNNSIKFSSKYVASPGGSADFPYRMMMNLYARADAAGIPNAVMAGFDSTWYFNFSQSVGLGDCDDSADGKNPRSKCIAALTDDIRDLALEAKKHPSATKAPNGRPILFIYTDHWQAHDQGHGGNQPSTAEWATILANARGAAGVDFYVVASSDGVDSFQVFDALAPWIGNTSYSQPAGTSIYTAAFNHQATRHQALVDGVAAYPERLVYGGITPGFDDWTRNWSQVKNCQERQLPPGAPRDPAYMTGEMDFFAKCKAGGGCTKANAKYDFRGFVGETWDDWTEGSEFEPDVHEGPAKLVQLRQLLGKVFGDAYPDAAGDARLSSRWSSYGQARNATGGKAGVAPVTDLACDATVPGSAPVVSSPANDSTQAGRIHVVADDGAGLTADAIQVYVDGVLAGADTGGALDVDVPTAGGPLAAGAHRLGVKAWFGGTPGPLTEQQVTVTSDPIALVSPAPNAITAGTVHVVGRDNDPRTATSMQVYVDGVMVYQLASPAFETLDRQISVGAPGAHRVGVKSWYADGTNLITEHAITVSSAAVVEVQPAGGATVHSPVAVQATDNSSKAAVSMQIYVDGVMVHQQANVEQLDANVPMSAGAHKVEVKSWYADGSSTLSAAAQITVQ